MERSLWGHHGWAQTQLWHLLMVSWCVNDEHKSASSIGLLKQYKKHLAQCLTSRRSLEAAVIMVVTAVSYGGGS